MNHKLLFPTYRKRYLFVRNVLERLTRGTKVERMLDVGCGEGDLDRLLVRFAERLDGCDANEGDVAFARELNADLGERVRYQVEDAGELSYATASFDVVVCLEVIEHVPDAQKVLSEIARVLRPGGHLVLTCPSAAFPFTYDPLNRLLGAVGVKVPVGAYGYGHSWLVRERELDGWLGSHGLAVQSKAHLSHHLAGLAECYVPGLVQRVLKANAQNRAGSRRSWALVPSREEPPLVALTDALVRLDDRWFRASERSVGLGYLARKVEG